MKNLLWLLVCLSVLAFLGFLAGLRSYQIFTREEPVAVVEIESPPPQSSYRFLLKMTPVTQGVEGTPQLFPMQGDQWAVAGEILKWHPWLNFVGIKNCHRLTRVSSRYLKVADEMNAPRSAYDLNGGTGFLWPILYRLQEYLPFVEAVYGNAAHTFAQHRSRWGVYVTLSGYLVRPLILSLALGSIPVPAYALGGVNGAASDSGSHALRQTGLEESPDELKRLKEELLAGIPTQLQEPGTLKAPLTAGLPVRAGLPVWAGLEERRYRGHTGSVLGVAFSQESRSVLSVGADGTLRRWSVQSGRPREPLNFTEGIPQEELTGRLFRTFLSPDGQTVGLLKDQPVKVGRAPAHSFWLRETRPGGKPQRLSANIGTVVSAALSPNRQAGADRQASPNGKMLAVGYLDGVIRLWNIQEDRLTSGPTLKGDQDRSHSKPVIALAFSPDGERLASVDLDGKVLLWSLLQGIPYHFRQANPAHGQVTGIAFSSKPTLFALGYGKGIISVLWGLDKVKEVGALTGPVTSLAFRSDVKAILSGGEDGAVHLWRLPRLAGLEESRGIELLIRDLRRSRVDDQRQGGRHHRDAVEALAKIGAPAVQHLLEGFTAAVPKDSGEFQDRPRENLRMGVAEALGKIGPEAAPAIPALIEALGNDTWKVHATAAEALGGIGPAAIPPLIGILRDHKDEQVSIGAASALGRMGPAAAGAVPALTKILTDTNPSSDLLRYHLVFALAKVGPQRDSIPALIGAFKDKLSITRQFAAEALGELGPAAAETVDLLNGISLNPEEEGLVRLAAVQALRKIKPEVSNDLNHASAHVNPDQKLSRTKPILPPPNRTIEPEEKRGPVGILRELLRDWERTVRLDAVNALGEQRSAAQEAIPDLIAVLANDSSAGIRAAAARALGQIGPAGDVTEALREALTDRSKLVRDSAHRALSQLAAGLEEKSAEALEGAALLEQRLQDYLEKSLKLWGEDKIIRIGGGLGEAGRETLEETYQRYWGEIRQNLQQSRQAISADWWRAQTRAVFIRLLQEHLGASSKVSPQAAPRPSWRSGVTPETASPEDMQLLDIGPLALFTVFFNQEGFVREAFSIPGYFHEDHVHDQGGNRWLGRGVLPFAFALRGTLHGELSSGEGFVRLDPPSNPEWFLKEKLGTDSVPPEVKDRYPDILAEEVVNLLAYLAEGGVHPDKPVILLTKVREALTGRYGVKILGGWTLGRLLSAIQRPEPAGRPEPASTPTPATPGFLPGHATAPLPSQPVESQAFIRSVRVADPQGIHLKTANQMVRLLESISPDTKVTLLKGDRSAEGRRITDLLQLAAGPGEEVQIIAQGPQAGEAVQVLVSFLAHVPESAGLEEPIDLSSKSGLPIALDPISWLLKFGEGVHAVTPVVRRNESLREVAQAPHRVTPQPSQIAYWMYRNVHHPSDTSAIARHQLRYDVTILAPSNQEHRLGEELVKTYGHYHPPRDPLTYPEVYEVLSGEAWFLLQRFRPGHPSIIEDFLLVKAKAGEKAIMLPGYGHVTINPSRTEPLVMANWVSAAFDSQYEQYQKHRGAAYYAIDSESAGVEFLPNKTYESISSIRQMRPAAALPEFGLKSGEPMYPLIREPEKLAFLNEPERFTEVFARALVPVTGRERLEALAEVLTSIGITQLQWGPLIQEDPALWRQAVRELSKAVRETPQSFRPLLHQSRGLPVGWGLELRSLPPESGAAMLVALEAGSSQPYEVYSGFAQFLRQRARAVGAIELQLNEKGAFYRGSPVAGWTLLDGLFLPEGLWEFLRDRHLTLSLAVPLDHQAGWDEIRWLLDPRILRRNVPAESDMGSVSISPPLQGPDGRVFSFLRGSIDSETRDPETGRIVPAVFILRSAAGLEEKSDKVNEAKRELRLGYPMHVYPSMTFVKLLQLFYPATNRAISLKFTNREDDYSIVDPEDGLDLLSLRIQPEDTLKVMAKGDAASEVLEQSLDAVQFLLEEIGKGMQLDEETGAQIIPRDTEYRIRSQFLERLETIKQALSAQKEGAPSSVMGSSEAKPAAQRALGQRLKRKILVENLAIDETDILLPLPRLEIAAHGHLLVPLQDRFRDLPGMTWSEVSTNLKEAKERLADFTPQEQIQRIGVLDEFYVSEDQAASILPPQHAPVFLVAGETATLLTPAVASAILKLQLAPNGLFVLQLRKDKLDQKIRLTLESA